MENLNAEQVIKALECCSKDDCDNCPNSFGNCYANLAGYALALINSQEQRIGELTQANEQLSESYDHLEKTKDELLSERSRLTEHNAQILQFGEEWQALARKFEAENEKLKAQKYYIHSDGRIEMVPTVESVRADTVRKMHFEIQQRCIKRGIYPLLVGYTLDQVAYEITGDDYFKPRYMLECKE